MAIDRPQNSDGRVADGLGSPLPGKDADWGNPAAIVGTGLSRRIASNLSRPFSVCLGCGGAIALGGWARCRTHPVSQPIRYILANVAIFFKDIVKPRCKIAPQEAQAGGSTPFPDRADFHA